MESRLDPIPDEVLAIIGNFNNPDPVCQFVVADKSCYLKISIGESEIRIHAIRFRGTGDAKVCSISGFTNLATNEAMLEFINNLSNGNFIGRILIGLPALCITVTAKNILISNLNSVALPNIPTVRLSLIESLKQMYAVRVKYCVERTRC